MGVVSCAGTFLAACFCTVAVSCANAADASLWLMPGVASLESHEFVFLPSENHKLSELIWRSEPMFTLNGGLELRLRPKTKLRLSGAVGFNGDSKMTDYDWLDADTPRQWTNRSIHDFTKLPEYVSLDGRISRDVAQRGGWLLSGLAGVRYDDVTWSAYGGKFVYSTFDDDGNLLGFRDDIFSLPNSERGITYRQQWLAPYVGVASTWTKDRSTITVTGIASPLTFSWDKDIHWQRDLMFTEKFSPGWMVSADIEYGYRLNPHASFVMSGGIETFAKVVGKTRITDLTKFNPPVSGPKKGAGASSLNVHGTVGMRFEF